MSVHFSSESNEWTTPIDFFNKYNDRYDFKTDLACTSINCLCENGFYMDKGINSLDQDWSKLDGWSWCNPPYGRELGKWVQKAYEENKNGARIVMLIPARTDTKYWHDYIFKGASVEFIRGRLKFGDGKNSAPFPSAVVTWS